MDDGSSPTPEIPRASLLLPDHPRALGGVCCCSANPEQGEIPDPPCHQHIGDGCAEPFSFLPASYVSLLHHSLKPHPITALDFAAPLGALRAPPTPQSHPCVPESLDQAPELPRAFRNRECIYNPKASLGTKIINEVLRLSSLIQFWDLKDLLMIKMLMPLAFQRRRG